MGLANFSLISDSERNARGAVPSVRLRITSQGAQGIRPLCPLDALGREFGVRTDMEGHFMQKGLMFSF